MGFEPMLWIWHSTWYPINLATKQGTSVTQMILQYRIKMDGQVTTTWQNLIVS